jgi:hypothetical protein
VRLGSSWPAGQAEEIEQAQQYGKSVLDAGRNLWLVDYGWEMPDLTVFFRTIATEEKHISKRGVRATLWVRKR